MMADALKDKWDKAFRCSGHGAGAQAKHQISAAYY